MAKDAKKITHPEAEIQYLSLRIPIMPPGFTVPTGQYVSREVDVTLRHADAAAWVRIIAACRLAASMTLRGGKPIATGNDLIRWLCEQAYPSEQPKSTGVFKDD